MDSETDDREVGVEIHPNAIVDDHTFEPISRQRKYQKRMAELGCCTKCGVFVEAELVYTRKGFVEKIFKLCPAHRAENRERQKQYRIYGGNA